MNPSGQMSPAQLNAVARAAIKQRAVNMRQQIYGQTFTASGTNNISASTPIVNVIPRNVGLIKGFWVKVVATITNNGTNAAATPSDLGGANLLSQIQFNDLNNNTRIQTTGWHVALINAAKNRRPYGASLVGATGIDVGGSKVFADGTTTDGTTATGFQTNFMTASITDDAGTGTVIQWYYVPLSYSDDDFRGAVYANVVNATMQLNLTFNPNPGATSTADSTSAVYIAGASDVGSNVVISAATITVYQDYLDQLPVGQGGVLLPVLDLATIYELKNTVVTSIVPAQDFPIQYSNFRDFLSTSLIYVNTASSGARNYGSDINYLALQSANFTNIWKLEPALPALLWRNKNFQMDWVKGGYYFPSREKPISTVQYGNMELIINASTAGTGAYALLGYEDFALVQSLSMAGSLAAS